MMNVNEHPAEPNADLNGDEVNESESVHAIPVKPHTTTSQDMLEQPFSSNIGHNTKTV